MVASVPSAISTTLTDVTVARKIGSKTLIEAESLRRFVAGLPALQPRADAQSSAW